MTTITNINTTTPEVSSKLDRHGILAPVLGALLTLTEAHVSTKSKLESTPVIKFMAGLPGLSTDPFNHLLGPEFDLSKC